MLILVWFIVCIIFAFVQLILGDSGHASEVFALLTAIALFLVNKLQTTCFQVLLILAYMHVP